MSDFERLGAFYLGKLEKSEGEDDTQDLLLYDSKDLTTHALCVGMTGSGKTGLCVGILEEAAIDGIPAIVIDPKGDIGNLMLTFPNLAPSDFRPWIDENEASKQGVTPDEFAQQTANLWKNGLSKWGQDGDRIAKLKAAADVRIYTPGSSAGLQISILKSFSAPSAEIMDDADALRDRIMGSVSGLLALLGIDADPVQSREHILLSNILNHAWKAGRNVELPDLIRSIMNPPFTQLGVFDVDTFYPSADRNALAMRLNNVLASPTFSSWMEGDPINIDSLMHSPEGKPQISILSIAHLDDAERMFFVTMVLNEMISWMRRQSGTSSLRALLYMDEIFGYFPPSANPPSKGPMLTLLKQARAFGLGCILATQNPVDLDYKGLGNTGTWFIGRLQTERDKLRVLDGLEGASAAAGKEFTRSQIDTALSGLGKRVFLMNNVHEDEPVLFGTRWVLSYLRGPMTKGHIRTLMAPYKKDSSLVTPTRLDTSGAGSSAAIQTGSVQAGSVQEEAIPEAEPSAQQMVSLPASIKAEYIRMNQAPVAGNRLIYRPMLSGTAQMHFVSAKAKLDKWMTYRYDTPFPDGQGTGVWTDCDGLEGGARDIAFGAAANVDHGPLPSSASSEKKYQTWSKMLKSHVYQHQVASLFFDPSRKMYSLPGESEGAFRLRLQQANREARDLSLKKLRDKYTPKLATMTSRIRKAEQRVDRETSQYENHRMSTAVSVGSTLLGALMGRKAMSVSSMRRAASSLTRAGSTMKEREDIARAKEDVEAAQSQLYDLEARFEMDAAELAGAFEQKAVLETLIVRPRKTDISVDNLSVLWAPWQIDGNGIASRLF